MKTCNTCNIPKPPEGYHRDPKSPDGRTRQCKPCRAAYRATTADQRREYAATWRAENPDYAATYREANRDRFRAYAAADREENPHIQWERRYRRRAVKYGHPVSVDSFTRAELIARHGDACVHCGGPFEHLDHYPVPVALGGVHSLDNCVPSCAACNLAQPRPRP